jgi:outer membrane receptor protein involved in Fe transport
LPDAIAELAREARVSIGTVGTLPHIRTSHLHGRMAIAEALARLLAGTDYEARQVGPTAWRIERANPRPYMDAPDDGPAPPPVPIVVTATKQPLALLSLPAAVTVSQLTEAQRNDPATNSATVSGQLDGLDLTSLGPGRNRMFLRGIADSAFSGESQSTVAVVLDEARLTYAAPDPDIRLVDIERVEVLKGPQGSLYGTGALGGIYRLVSHPAQIGETSLSLTGGGSLVAHGGTGYSSSIIANLPVTADSAALRLVGYSTREPGWVDTGLRHDANVTRVNGARALLGVVPAEGWRLDLTGFAQWLEAKDSRYVYVSRSFSRPDQLAEPHDNDLRHLAARLTGGIGTIDLTLASALTWHSVDQTLDATVGADNFGLADPQSFYDRRSYRVWDSELRLRGNLGALDWLAGISHLEARQHLATSLAGQTGSELVLDDDKRFSHDTAAYLDLTLPLTSELTLDGGGRLFRSSIREIRILGDGPVSRERDKTGLTPSLALAWQPNADRLIYLRYGSAFRQGGSDISPGGTIEELKGDELASVEAGWRERLAGGGHFELNAWYAVWENLQSDILQPDGLIETANAGDARILGAEASASFALARNWHFEAGANFTSALLTRNALGYELHDRRLPVVPKYTLRTALRHDFTIGTARMWVRAGLRYIGSSRMSFDPDLDRPMGKLWNGSIEAHAALGAWELGVSARNLFGDKNNVFAFGNALRYRTMPQFTPQQPLTVSLTATLNL